jgi:Rne/Rng family ribonuclease
MSPPRVQLVLEDTGFGLRAAVVEQGRLVELRDADRDQPRVTDALFAARVTAVDAKLNAAFLDCGLPQPALLVAKDARAVAGAVERRPIRDLVREGQRLVVQGLREPVEGKGARVTSDVKLFGFALIHTPLAEASDLVHRLGGRRQGDALRERGRALFPDGRFVLRRHAAELADDALLAEAAQLAAGWQQLETMAARTAAKPGRLPELESPLERLLRSLVDLEPAEIAIADRVLLRELNELQATRPTLPPLALVPLEPDQPAFEQTGVAAELELTHAREVPLSGGGRVTIESTAACVAIDVDGGGRAPLDTDLEAAGEIGRQIRLRNLGGTIIVDFVDLPTRPERQRLEEALRKAFRGDPAPFEIHAMSALGIVQISRARRGETLAARYGAPCRCCGGSGLQASPRAGAEQLLAALRAARRPLAGVRAAGDLERFLVEGAGAAAWRRTLAAIGYAPALTVDSTLPPAGFVVEERPDAR